MIASMALATGLVLLSFSGGIFSLTGQALQEDGSTGLDPDLDGVEPPETGINASQYIDEETARQAADSDIVTKLARGLFEFLSGQDLEPPTDIGGNGSIRPDDGSVNGTDGANASLPDGEGGGETNATDGTGDGGNVTDGNATDGDGTTGGTNATDGDAGPNMTGGQDDTNTTGDDQDTNMTDGSDDRPQNETDDSQTDPGGQNASMPDGNASSSDGFLSDMVQRFADVLGGSGQDGTSPDDRESGSGQQDGDSGDDGGMMQSLGGLKALLVPLVIVGLAVGGLLVYRSDKSLKEIVKMLLDRAGSFVRSLPDLLGRSIVRAVSAVIAAMERLWDAAVRLVHAPGETVQRAWAIVLERLEQVRSWVAAVRERSVRENVDMIVHGSMEELEGLDRLWMRLKEAVGIEDGSMTPVEVGWAAIEHGFPRETVEEIVAALRERKYSSRARDTIDIDRWERALWGDDDV
jgi:hypothetical protein